MTTPPLRACAALFSVASLAVACGGGSSVSSDRADAASIVGMVFVSTDTSNGALTGSFDVNLQPIEEGAPDACAGATQTLGSCCYFAPSPPPPTQPPGKGNPATEANAGPLTLKDVTSSAHIGTFDYGGGGYTDLPASYTNAPWSPGDLVSLSATGDAAGLGAFAISARTLNPPSTVFPSLISRTQDLVLSWVPDANAQTMTVAILDTSSSGQVSCSTPDSAGSVTVDAHLFSAFQSGAALQGNVFRMTTQYTQTPSGRIEVRSTGYEPFRASVE